MFLKNIANIEKIFHFFRWMGTFHCFYQLSDHKVALCFITHSVKHSFSTNALQPYLFIEKFKYG